MCEYKLATDWQNFTEIHLANEQRLLCDTIKRLAIMNDRVIIYHTADSQYLTGVLQTTEARSSDESYCLLARSQKQRVTC